MNISSRLQQLINIAKKNASGAAFVLYGNDKELKEKLVWEFIAKIIEENDISKIHVNSDFFHISANKGDKLDISIIKELQQFLHFKVVNAKYKIALLEDIDLMNRHIQNALLKTLEELATNTFIITTATTIAKVAATLRSRCFKFRYDYLKEHTYKAFENNALYNSIQNIIKDKNRNTLQILEIGEQAALNPTSWQIAKDAILIAMREIIKDTKEKDILEKRLQYYDNVKLLFANAEIYNLNKQDIIFNVLS